MRLTYDRVEISIGGVPLGEDARVVVESTPDADRARDILATVDACQVKMRVLGRGLKRLRRALRRASICQPPRRRLWCSFTLPASRVRGRWRRLVQPR